MNTIPYYPQVKLITYKREVKELLNSLHFADMETKHAIFLNGCFDGMHPGHRFLFLQAAMLGWARFQKKAFFIIALNDDGSIQRLKGRAPQFTLEQRLKALRWNLRELTLSVSSYLGAPFITQHDSAILPFTGEDLLSLIKSLRPGLLVKGGDYSLDASPGDKRYIVGAEEMKLWGGESLIIPRVGSFSTTNIIERIDE